MVDRRVEESKSKRVPCGLICWENYMPVGRQALDALKHSFTTKAPGDTLALRITRGHLANA
jgi:hypothetical protein